MTEIVIIALVIGALAAAAVAYVAGYFNGEKNAKHPDGPETCRAKLQAAETVAQMWRARALEREQQVNELLRRQTEHERNETATVTMLLEELDELEQTAMMAAAVLEEV